MSGAWYRPLPQTGEPRPHDALQLAGGRLWFDTVVEHRRGQPPHVLPVQDLAPEVSERLCAPRAPLLGLTLDRPRIMGVLNMTPDSFSDGGRHNRLDLAIARARDMIAEGADILDIGGESTRPGSDTIPEAEEIARVLPVIKALRSGGLRIPISIDTRNAAVARASFAAGADLFNDVSALAHDADSLGLAAASGRPVCLMHAQGDPKTMQDAPVYDDVLLDVVEFLSARVTAAEAAGIPRSCLLVDPGLGFGKTAAHNLALVRGLAILHGLGCGILLGASRKRFIGLIGGAAEPSARLPGSIAVALEGLRQGAQVIRVHDVAETRQALALWLALNLPAETERSGS